MIVFTFSPVMVSVVLALASVSFRSHPVAGSLILCANIDFPAHTDKTATALCSQRRAIYCVVKRWPCAALARYSARWLHK